MDDFPKSTVPEMLSSLGEIYEQRNKVYGDNYKRFGLMMSALFPDGLVCKTPYDFNRLGIFIQMASKMSRYANSYKQKHGDSLDDLAVYSQMMREIDGEEK